MPIDYVSARNLAAKTRIWLKSIAPYNRHALRLRARRSCLLVIDMQRYFVDPQGAAYLPSAQAILGNVGLLVRSFRAARRPVIYTRHMHHPDGLDAGMMGTWWGRSLLEGTAETEIHPALAPAPTDKIVMKHRYSAFYDTDLETVLRVLGIEDLGICGVLTNLCCETTARDAFSRDFRVFFHADATGTETEEMHRASLLNLAYGFACVTTAGKTASALQGRGA